MVYRYVTVEEKVCVYAVQRKLESQAEDCQCLLIEEYCTASLETGELVILSSFHGL